MHRTLCLGLALLCGCAHAAAGGAHVVASASRDGSAPAWTESEKAAAVSLKNLRESPGASFHLLRVRTELPARMHESSDLVLMLVSGGAEITLGDRKVPLSPGDVVEVPEGSVYSVRNRGSQAAVAYLVFSPALSPSDTKLVSQATRESVWKWNLWLQ